MRQLTCRRQDRRDGPGTRDDIALLAAGFDGPDVSKTYRKTAGPGNDGTAGARNRHHLRHVAARALGLAPPLTVIATFVVLIIIVVVVLSRSRGAVVLVLASVALNVTGTLMHHASLAAGDRIVIRYLVDPRSCPECYILTERASDARNGFLSVSSPLAVALADASPGDEFRFILVIRIESCFI